MPKRVRRKADRVRWLIEEGLCDYDDLRLAGLLGPPPLPDPRRRPTIVDPSTVFVMDKPLAYHRLGPLLTPAYRADRAAQAR